MGHLFPWVGEQPDTKGHDAGGEHGSISLITPAYAQPGHAAPAAPAAPAAEHGAPQPAAGHGAVPGMPSAPHGNGPEAKEHAEHQAHAQIHTELMAKKSGYLNKNFFYVRARPLLLHLVVPRAAPARLLRRRRTPRRTRSSRCARKAFAPASDVPLRAEPHVRRVRLDHVARADVVLDHLRRLLLRVPAWSRATRSSSS